MTDVAIAIAIAIVVLIVTGVVLHNVPLDDPEGLAPLPLRRYPRFPGDLASTSYDKPRPTTPDVDALESIVDYAIGYAVGSFYDVTKASTDQVAPTHELSKRIQDGVRRHLDRLELEDIVRDDVGRARARLRVAVERVVIADKGLTLEQGLDLYLIHPELVDALFFLGEARDELRKSLGGTPS